jgi:hypothetical protein
MSARAAWRLEELGFRQVYDYVPSKIDWFANGLPREGKAAEIPSGSETLSPSTGGGLCAASQTNRACLTSIRLIWYARARVKLT